MRRFLRYLLALTFTSAGIAHFGAADTYTKIMPDYLPYPLALVYISGLAEIAGGVGVLPKVTRKWAGFGLLALLLAVYPANIDMALNGTERVGINIPRWVWWARLPFQFLFFAWVWYAAIQKEKE